MSGVDYKEGTNLLDIGSSESEQEHFALPPLKGHKPKSRFVIIQKAIR